MGLINQLITGGHHPVGARFEARTLLKVMFLVHIQEVFLAESILILIGGFKHELYFHPSH